MAIVYECDRCGEQFKNGRNELRKIELPHMTYNNYQFTDEEEGYTKDICAPCARDMKATFDAGKKVGKG